jgi:acyl carrier protein
MKRSMGFLGWPICCSIKISMKKYVIKILIIKLVMSVSILAFAKIPNKYGNSIVEENIKRIVAERLNTNAERITNKATFKTLGSDELVDPVLILTDIQYYFNIKLDPKTFKKLSKPGTKIADVVTATMGKVYPIERFGDTSGPSGD